MREGTKKKYSTAQIDTLKTELITWKKGKKTQLWIAGGFVSRYQLFVLFFFHWASQITYDLASSTVPLRCLVCVWVSMYVQTQHHCRAVIKRRKKGQEGQHWLSVAQVCLQWLRRNGKQKEEDQEDRGAELDSQRWRIRKKKNWEVRRNVSSGFKRQVFRNVGMCKGQPEIHAMREFKPRHIYQGHSNSLTKILWNVRKNSDGHK